MLASGPKAGHLRFLASFGKVSFPVVVCGLCVLTHYFGLESI